MNATRLAAVFDIDAEDYVAFLRVSSIRSAVRGRECPNTREDDRIGRGRARHWPANPVVIRIAEVELIRECNVSGLVLVGRTAARQASAVQSVIGTLGRL